MAVPTSSEFKKWDGSKFSDTDWDQNVDKTVEILADGTYDLNVNQITASTYVGL
jgi:predicted  nucleic acid-binding Zn-ribbon protein